MIRVFDFLCPECGETSEEFVDHDKKHIPCACGGHAERQLAAPRSDYLRMGIDPGFPGAWAKWEKAKRKHHTTDKGGSEKGHNLKMY